MLSNFTCIDLNKKEFQITNLWLCYRHEQNVQQMHLRIHSFIVIMTDGYFTAVCKFTLNF